MRYTKPESKRINFRTTPFQREKLVLADRAREAFLYLLDNPREPTETMKAALKKYRKLGLDKKKIKTI